MDSRIEIITLSSDSEDDAPAPSEADDDIIYCGSSHGSSLASPLPNGAKVPPSLRGENVRKVGKSAMPVKRLEVKKMRRSDENEPEIRSLGAGSVEKAPINLTNGVSSLVKKEEFVESRTECRNATEVRGTQRACQPGPTAVRRNVSVDLKPTSAEPNKMGFTCQKSAPPPAYYRSTGNLCKVDFRTLVPPSTKTQAPPSEALPVVAVAQGLTNRNVVGTTKSENCQITAKSGPSSNKPLTKAPKAPSTNHHRKPEAKNTPPYSRIEDDKSGLAHSTNHNRKPEAKNSTRQGRIEDDKFGSPDCAKAPSPDSTTPSWENHKTTRPAPSPSKLSFSDQVIRVNPSTCWLLLTQKSVMVAGALRLICFAGSVEIAGHTAAPNGEEIMVPSLASDSLMSIHGGTTPVAANHFAQYVRKFLAFQDFDLCLNVLDRHYGRVFGVVLVMATSSVSDPSLWCSLKRFPGLLPPLALLNADLPADVASEWMFPGCRLLAGDVDRRSYVDYQDGFWKQIRLELKGYPRDFEHVILVCGDKNTGKSTTVRYIINHLLKTFPAVQCLDCDLGQSEFNPPGCVAMHTLTKPVIGPVFSRLQEPDVACFIGEVTPANFLTFYEQALERVFHEGRKAHLPLVINSMGWIKEAGLRLLQSTAKLTCPKLVLELNWNGRLNIAKGLVKAEVNRSLALHSGFALTTATKGFKPSLRRKISQLAYLARESQISPFVPFGVPFSDVYICFTEPNIPVSHCLTTLLGSYVGLCSYRRTPHDGISVYKVSCVKVLRPPPIALVHGFGIVRAIDLERQMCYISTPMSEFALARVNLIFRGSMTLPEEVFLQQNLASYQGIVPRRN